MVTVPAAMVTAGTVVTVVSAETVATVMVTATETVTVLIGNY